MEHNFFGEILPLLLLTAGVYLVKVGAFSAVIVLLRKFRERVRRSRALHDE